jgi:maltooligosyltrehalose synthase
VTSAHDEDDERRQRPPSATYRLQFTADFTLERGAELAGYLADLGVTHAYASPLLRSAEGSTHGYDTVDHAHIDEARGGGVGLDRLVGALHGHGLGLVLDLVPNHMGVADAAAAPWWWDVLKHGRDSAHAAAFDVDWEFGGGKVRIPVLGSADDLAKLDVAEGPDGPELRYYDNRYPIAPGTAEGSPQEVHARQHYELVDWRRADTDLNYRRFFAINTLAGLRAEDRRSSPRPTGWSPSWWSRARSTRCGSTTRTAWPIPRATSTGWRRRPAAGGPSWRRSSSPVRSCRRAGRAPAPPATTRWPRWTASSSTGPARPR